MNKGIRILKPGFYTTIQDHGRFGYGHLGIPESGAMNQKAHELANVLLNNNPNDAALECTLVGPHIKFWEDTYFVITGAWTSAHLNGVAVMERVPVFAKAGQILTLSKLTQGVRSYIAFAGGLQSPVVLGSRSHFKPVTTMSTVSKGLDIKIGPSNFSKQKGVRLKLQRASLVEVEPIKVYAGPEYSFLSTPERKRLLTTTFTVSKLWNRMAVQLEELLPNTVDPIRTSPVVPGTVQLTPSGKVIVLTRDCQTTGGYSRVLQLSQMSLDKVAQMQYGDKLLFSFT